MFKKPVFFFIYFAFFFALYGCVNLNPYRVGDNIDDKNSISYAVNLPCVINDMSKQICNDSRLDKKCKIGLSDFLNTNDMHIDKDGLYMKNLLYDDLSRCSLNVEKTDFKEWFEVKKNDVEFLNRKTDTRYFIVGTYFYCDKQYRIIIRAVDTKTDKVLTLSQKNISVKEINFDLNRLDIPREIKLIIP